MTLSPEIALIEHTHPFDSNRASSCVKPRWGKGLHIATDIVADVPDLSETLARIGKGLVSVSRVVVNETRDQVLD